MALTIVLLAPAVPPDGTRYSVTALVDVPVFVAVTFAMRVRVFVGVV